MCTYILLSDILTSTIMAADSDIGTCLLPLSRIKTIMKSSPEISAISQESLFGVAKATVSIFSRVLYNAINGHARQSCTCTTEQRSCGTVFHSLSVVNVWLLSDHSGIPKMLPMQKFPNGPYQFQNCLCTFKNPRHTNITY